MKDSFTVHDLPLSERPRERLLKLGSEALSAQEILALILGRGIKGESVIEISQKLLSRFGNLKGVANASVEELTQTRGIGPAKAAQIKAALELSKRLEAAAQVPGGCGCRGEEPVERQEEGAFFGTLPGYQKQVNKLQASFHRQPGHQYCSSP
jgi:PHP family Zn ribbon phosphoesterase